MKSLRLWRPHRFIVLLVLLFSCQQQEEILKQVTPDHQNENFISSESAEDIAENLRFNRLLGESSKGEAGRKSVKEIESILDVPDSSNVTAYYIINYKEGGFVILAGDKRSEPILAFSETGHFNWQAERFPSGLVGWLFSAKQNMEQIRRRNDAARPEIKRQWERLTQSGTDVVSSKIEPEEPDCTPYSTQKGPFLQTTWGQGCGYNELTPYLSCNQCGHAWTGCVATAMAQIMKYHQYPVSYSWSNMPNSSGTYTTAGLMRYIGDAVDMDYSCDGSAADTKTLVALAFKYVFGYSTASYADYNYQTVKNEISNNRPVILRGGRNTGWWIFGQYSDGHAWVCDGSLEYVDPCGGSILKFHMNWGWGDNVNNYNAWYSFNNFNPGDHTFNYKTGMVYNIKP